MLQHVTSTQSSDGGHCRLLINRPKGNVLTAGVMQELLASLKAAAANPSTKLITIEAAGAHFSFGAAIEEHVPEKIREVLPVFRELILQVAASEVPVAAVVRGVCFGGALELVAACHFVFAAPDARLALPEIRLGVFPPPACALLPMRVGQSLADRMVLTGAEMRADSLTACGFVTGCFASEALEANVQDWYQTTLASSSASSIRHATRASRAQFCRGLAGQLAQSESAYLGPLMETADANEGISAYLAKRPPAWSNA